jgi:hypothetical protein
MQNRLPDIAGQVDDIAEIVALERSATEAGHDRVVNVWKAAPPLPDFLKSMVQPDMLAWTDSAVWNPDNRTCHWVIESHYFREKMVCSGVTTYQPALGGKGCRLSFEGELRWSAGMTNGVLIQGMDTVLSSLIPSNFRKTGRCGGGVYSVGTECISLRKNRPQLFRRRSPAIGALKRRQGEAAGFQQIEIEQLG